MDGAVRLKYSKDRRKLVILKLNARNTISYKDGKYGVQGCYDIEDNLIGLCIPEPEILFGIDEKDLENFFKEELI